MLRMVTHSCLMSLGKDVLGHFLGDHKNYLVVYLLLSPQTKESASGDGVAGVSFFIFSHSRRGLRLVALWERSSLDLALDGGLGLNSTWRKSALRVLYGGLEETWFRGLDGSTMVPTAHRYEESGLGTNRPQECESNATTMSRF